MRAPHLQDRLAGRAALVALVPMLALTSASCHGAGPEPDPATAPAPTSTATASPTESPTEPTILFQRNGTRRPHVAWVSRDGSGESAPLTDFGTGAQTNPDWSPDGTRLAFVMTDVATDDLFIADAGAPDATKLVDCVGPCLYLDDPAWSPDGKRVVFSRTVDRDGAAVSTLETVEVSTGRTRVLLGPWTEQSTAGARWSPDGHQIVFELVHKAGPALDADLSGVTLSVLSLDGPRTVRSLTDPELLAATADWSPDGRWIVYSALATATDEASELFRISARGGYPHQLTHLVELGGYAAEPTFTPDGTFILFSGGRGPDEADLLLQLAADGTGLSPATGDVEVHGRHPRVR